MHLCIITLGYSLALYRQLYPCWVRASVQDILLSMKSIYSPAYRSLLGWLRASRVAKHLSMRDVGKRMNMPHTWVGKAETGERRLDVEEFVRLCQALDIVPEQGIAIIKAAISTPVSADTPGDIKPVTARPKPTKKG